MDKKNQAEPSCTKKYYGTFVDGFLLIAKNSIEDLRKRKNIGKIIVFPGQKPTYRLRERGLIVSCIWNIKHAIELIVKSLGIGIDKEYLKIHKLEKIFKNFKKKSKNSTRKTSINKLEKLVFRYYKCKIFQKINLIENKQVADIQNDIFRYPDNASNADIDFKVLQTISRKDLSALLKDIKDLKEIFHRLETEIQFIPNLRKWGVSKKEINKRFRKK